MKKVLILEGPAGSGKTHFLQQQQAVVRLEYSGRTKTAETAFEHFQLKLAKALEMSSEEVWIDRGGLSQAVYGTIRGETTVEQVVQSLAHYLQAFEELQRSFGIKQIVKVQFVLLVPSLQTILERRAKSNRSYPYSASEEQELYIKAYLLLPKAFRGGIRNE